MQARTQSREDQPAWPFYVLTEEQAWQNKPEEVKTFGQYTFARFKHGPWVLVDTANDNAC